MTYLYFDESIRENGNFIVGALVVSEVDLSDRVTEKWMSMGLDPSQSEYKSSASKLNNALSNEQREVIAEFLRESRLALLVCPMEDRDRLGSHLCALGVQLAQAGMLGSDQCTLHVDQGIALSPDEKRILAHHSIEAHDNQDSRALSGLQVADHAAHLLGSMLLDQMGLLRKTFRVGEEYGYVPEVEIEIGYALWASIRNALIGLPQEREVPDSAAIEHHRRMEGYGLYIAPNCSPSLASHVRVRFGAIWLGCLH